MSECTHDCSSCGESCGERTAPMDFRAPMNPLSDIKKVIAVVSGKGGVGKSTVTCTLAAAMGACSARHYGGYCTQITPAYADAAAYTRSEDVFGDSYVVYEASASYTIRYQMPDESRLTVGERDRILTRYRDAVQAFLDGKTEDELSKEEAMTRALKRELKRLDQSLSTQWMALEGTRLNDYFAYGPEGGETP